MKPHLFGAAIAEAPFVDVVGTILDTSIPLTVEEYEEWGDPRVYEEFRNILSYSPYSNLKNVEHSLPPTLMIGSLLDHRVMYWEPLKWTALVRLTYHFSSTHAVASKSS